MLRRLELRFGRIMALIGLGTAILGGDAGGEAVAIIVSTATAAPLIGDARVRAVADCCAGFPRGRKN
jgi:hypothetical protein